MNTPLKDFLGRLALPPAGRARRVSSNEQPNWSDGNFDMTPLPPGTVLEMPVLQGPGVLNHLWFTSHSGGVNELNALTLRIYWDGRAEPGVEVPLADFFAVGQGTPAPVESVPVQVSPSGSLSCYWRMPFARSARITVTNDHPDRWSGLYWQADWTELDSLPPGTGYFHARYRQEFPAGSGRDYLVAELAGSGNYVGTVLSVTLAQDGWFGEGDDFFFVDGEKVPGLQGTGTEDYFNDAWGFRARTGAWFGQPRWEGDAAGDSGVCYRWHVLDPIPFRHTLRFTLEHKGNHPDAVDGWFFERPDYLSSVALWYQLGEPAPWPALPGWPERCVPWCRTHLVTSFCTARWHAAGPPRVETHGFFGARPALAWCGHEPGATLTIPFRVAQAGRYAVRLTAFASPGGGRATAAVGTAPAQELCLDAPGFEEQDINLGVHDLAAGEQELVVRPAAGSAGTVLLEQLRLLALPPAGGRAVKGPTEAHFVRLGIARAAYAHRLAYGAVPESLEMLVERGLLPERYLRDENGHPLTARFTGEALVVSSARGGWEHTVRGLDARR